MVDRVVAMVCAFALMGCGGADSGPPGESGETGKDGSPGAPGEDGMSGGDGVDGVDGDDGLPGPGGVWVDANGDEVKVAGLLEGELLVFDSNGIIWMTGADGVAEPVHVEFEQFYESAQCQGPMWLRYSPPTFRMPGVAIQPFGGDVVSASLSTTVDAHFEPESWTFGGGCSDSGDTGPAMSLEGATTLALPSAPLFVPPLHLEPSL